MQQEKPIELRDSVRRRLEFIDFRLFWDGSINRSDLRSTFRISDQQASADLARYQALAPGNITYDSSLKTYRCATEFKPVMRPPSARHYLSQIRLIDDEVIDVTDTWIGRMPSYSTVPLLRRRTSMEILKPICDAIRNNHAIETCYRSFGTPEPHWRWIEPHSLVFDSRRWHVRAWCRNRKAFRDFVIARMNGIRGSSPYEIDSQLDLEWHRTVVMRISPNPQLNSDQHKIIQLEYGMDQGGITLETRISLVFYVKDHLRLKDDPSKLDAIKEHLYLENAGEVYAAVEKASRDSHNLIQSSVEKAYAI